MRHILDTTLTAGYAEDCGTPKNAHETVFKLVVAFPTHCRQPLYQPAWPISVRSSAKDLVDPPPQELVIAVCISRRRLTSFEVIDSEFARLKAPPRVE